MQAAADEGNLSASAAQHTRPLPKCGNIASPSQETPSHSSGLVMDASPLLQQLQLFQDQLRLFASPTSAASGLRTPQQPTLADQQAETVKHKAAMSDAATFKGDEQEMSTAVSHAQPAAGQSAIASHDSFRQAMMERLRRDSQIGTIQSPLDPPLAHPSFSSPAQRYQHALSPQVGVPMHSTASPWMGSENNVSGGHPIRHMRGDSAAGTSASSDSPASRALQSIRSVLRSLPETPTSAEGASRVHRASERSGLGRLSSSWAFSTADTETDKQEADADREPYQDGAAVHEDEDPCQSRRLSVVEKEVVRILGPRYGSADVSSGAGRSEMSKAKTGSDGNLARTTSGR